MKHTRKNKHGSQHAQQRSIKYVQNNNSNTVSPILVNSYKFHCYFCKLALILIFILASQLSFTLKFLFKLLASLNFEGEPFHHSRVLLK